MIYQFRTLLTALFMVATTIVMFSQTYPVSMTYTWGSWYGEPGWEIVQVSNGAVVNCEAAGGTYPANGSVQNLNLAAGQYQVRGFDSYGDGWNGCTLKFVEYGLTLFDGGLVSGGITNTCPGPSAGYVIVGTFTVLAPSACAITCPPNITVNNDPGVCTANVTVPAPVLSQCTNATVVNNFNNTNNASGVYPIGTTSVKWTAQEPNGFPQTCTMTVTVNNTSAVELTCPSNMAFTLDPGDCEAFPVWDTPIAFSCNKFGGGAPATVTTLNSGGNGGSSGGMVWYNVVNHTNSNMDVVQMSANISNATVINIYLRPGTYVGNTGSSAGWTLAYSANVTTGPFSGPYPGNGTLTPFPVNFAIPPGNWAIAFHTVSASQNYTNGNGANQFYSDGNLDISLGAAYNTPWYAAPFTPRVWNGSISYTQGTFTTEATQIAGPASGTGFPVGVTTVTYSATDSKGNTAECSFTVTVNNFPNPTSTLACNDEVQISVDEDCEAYVGADMILEGGPYSCYDDYSVEIFTQMPAITFGAHGNVSNPVSPGSYWVGIYDEDGNNCWGHITVKDKLPPVMECRDVTVTCDEGAGSVTEPAPAVVGYQQILKEGLHDVVDNNSFTYNFDYSYLPAGTPALDVNLRLLLTGHTYLPDLIVKLTAPDGTSANVMTIGGCTGQEWPIDCWFDDEGASITQCVELNCGGCALAPLQTGFSTPSLLTGFEGVDASGIWKIQIDDTFLADDGVIETVGLAINVNLPQVVPYDACGPMTLTHTDAVVENYCVNPAQVVTRTWKAVDAAGNSTSCVQTINVLLPDLSTFTWPLNWDGLVNIGNYEMLECDGTYPLDANGNPSPAYTGWPADGDDYCGTLEVFYNDDVYHLACGVKILRNWTVVNDCSGEVIKHVQVIRIDDNTAPTFCAPENLTAKTKAYVCDSDIKVPVLNCLKDNCDAFPRWWVTTNAGIVSGDKNGNGFVDANETWYVLGVPMGTYDLCYHATDNCGNVATYCVKVTVIDGVPPIPVCEQYKQVSLTGYGHAKVFADDYDSGSFDNCNPVYFKVLRVNSDLVYDGGCKDLNGDDNPATPATIDVWYDDAVFFCCDDINKEVMVSLRVFDVNPGVGPVNPSRMLPGGDLYGHFNDCWNITYIECKIPPVLTCKPVTITCEESLDPKENAKLVIDVVALCDLDLTYADARDNSTCGANITRTWTAKGCGKTTTCKQAITVVGSTPFDPCTIVFPADKQVHCTNDLPDGGKPTWDEFPCNVITAEFKDDTFKFVEGSCYKILREWAVIDWCVYKPNVGAEYNVDAVTSARKLNCNTLVKDGYYRYTQVLKVVDLIPPVITAQDQCVGTTDCYAYNVTMTATASDTCNTNEEYWWKYKVENLDCVCEPIQVSYNYLPKPATAAVGKRSLDKLDKVTEGKLVLINPAVAGHYKVTWTVGDGCGNATTKYQYFTIADKKAPTPVMVDLATAVMQNGMVALKARWFDKGGCGDGCISSWDNCTSKDELYFTFSPMIPNLWNEPTKWANQYAQYGKMFFDPATGAISTEAKYLQGKADAWYPQSRSSERVFICDYVEVGNSTKTMPIYVWDQFALDADCDDHNYDFANVVVNFNHCTEGQPLVSGNVQINTMKVEAKYNEGTFTTTSNEAGDYTLGVNANTEYKVSGSKDADWLNGVTTLDLVIIQKFLVGLKSITDPKLLLAADINNNGEITAADLLEARKVILGTKDRFTNNSWIAVNPVTNKRETVVNVSTTNISDVDFVAVKIGDMNNNAVANRNAASVRFMTDDAVVKAGEMVEVPFYAENFDGIYGAQFTMNLGGMSLENVKAGAITLDESNYNVVNGNLIVSFNEAKGLNVADGNVLFTVELKANVDGKLSNLLSINDQVLKSEIYAGKDLDINSIEIGYRNADVNYALYQNEPNPFVGKTTIGFELPTDANYTLTVYDVTGKELKVINSRGVAGYNSVAIDGINTTGVMTYRLQSDDFTATKKMVSIK